MMMHLIVFIQYMGVVTPIFEPKSSSWAIYIPIQYHFPNIFDNPINMIPLYGGLF